MNQENKLNGMKIFPGDYVSNPMMKFSGNFIIYFQDGKIHNETGPAIITPNGSKYWYIKGKLYRENGPSIEYLSESIFKFIGRPIFNHRDAFILSDQMGFPIQLTVDCAAAYEVNVDIEGWQAEKIAQAARSRFDFENKRKSIEVK